MRRQCFEPPPGLVLDEHQHRSGNKLVVPKPMTTDDHCWMAVDFLEEPEAVEGTLQRVRSKICDLTRPRAKAWPPKKWVGFATRDVDTSDTAMQLEVSPGRRVNTRWVSNHEALILWQSDGEALNPDDMRQLYPTARKVVERGNAVIVSDFHVPSNDYELSSFIPDTQNIGNPVFAQEIHVVGQKALQKKFRHTPDERADPGMMVLSEAMMSGRIKWATLGPQDEMIAQQDLGVKADHCGWFVIIPQDHYQRTNMDTSYQFFNSQNNAIQVKIAPFTTCPQFAAVLDARWRVHLYDAATKIEGGHSLDDDFLMGDVRAAQAQMAAAQLISERRYYDALDAMIRQFAITPTMAINTFAKQDSTLKNILVNWGNSAIADEPIRSSTEKESMNGVHLMSLGLRSLKGETQEKKIEFMRQVRTLSGLAKIFPFGN